MRSRFLTLVALLILPSLCRGDDAADAKAVIEKAVKATGYKLDDKPPAMTWKDKGKFTAADFALDYTGDFAFQGPDKYRFVINAELEGMKIAITAIVNGDKSWQSAMGTTEEVTGDKLDYVRGEVYQHHVMSLLPLLSDKEFKLATAGEQEINKKKTLGVKVTRDKQTPITLYFDSESGLLTKLETKVKDEFQAWKEVPNEVYLEEYKDIGGKKFFKKMKVVRDGKTMIVSEMSDQKSADKLDAKLFEKP